MLGRARFAYDWTHAAGAHAGRARSSRPTRPRASPRSTASSSACARTSGRWASRPAAPGRHSSIPPGDHGGNIDNWRIGAGGRMLYPVQVAGALLSVGDPHVSQGDGEVSGTALEASLNGLLRLTIRRDLDVRVPVLETAGELLVHGFGDDLDEAMLAAVAAHARPARLALRPQPRRRLLVHERRRRLHVTQVVDGRQGVHGRIDKRCFPRFAAA